MANGADAGDRVLRLEALFVERGTREVVCGAAETCGSAEGTWSDADGTADKSLCCGHAATGVDDGIECSELLGVHALVYR